MKKAILIVLLIAFYVDVNAQSAKSVGQSCSVILFNDQWLIKSYHIGERPLIDLTAKGVISVHETGDIFVKSFKKEKLLFSIAIKKSTGETEALFENATLRAVKAQDVLKKCKPGDKIVLFLKDSQSYILPHYEIEVLSGEGC
jgi:hypothetical protein